MTPLPRGSTLIIARPTRYTLDAPEGYEHESIMVEQTGKLLAGRFVADANVWAVRKRGWCLNVDGDWEYEPQPSSRDDAFFARCRFRLDDALHRAQEAIQRDNHARGDSR